MNRLMSKHSSDYNVLFCHDPLSQLAIVASLHLKLMHTRTESPRFDSTLRNKTRRYGDIMLLMSRHGVHVIIR